jgi:hypothetical protein
MKYYVAVNDHGTFWYRDPECTILHREGGPAAEYTSGVQRWYLNGKLHREDGPAIYSTDGSIPKYWCIDGVPHRENGPAVEFPNGDKHWYFKGERHRENGPAVELANGRKRWYLHGQWLSEAKVKARMATCADKVIKIDGKKYKLVAL